MLKNDISRLTAVIHDTPRRGISQRTYYMPNHLPASICCHAFQDIALRYFGVALTSITALQDMRMRAAPPASYRTYSHHAT